LFGEKGGSEQTERSVTQVTSDSKKNTAALFGQQPSANNMQPYLAVNFIIALIGVFPSRN